MALTIQTTGIEQYAAGGEGRLQIMVIGGPGAGKTRFSSYWPRPIYANCEAGLSSIADRKMPFVNINKSQDMLELLAMLEMECRRPFRDRTYQTVIVDTLDAFQRKVKDEWLRANPGAQSFRGFDAWGYLDAKMQMLLTRLLNLDMNVVVLAHYKDKTIREGQGENATERQELMLQLSGDVKDAVFNDFDLVGWMGTYWEVEDGQRVEKRGLTFKKTPEKPFLKDRLHVTPNWLEVTFSDEDYAKLFEAVLSRIDEMPDSEVIGEVPALMPAESMPSGGVVSNASGGALPPIDPKDVPLEQFDKPTLQQMARDLGCEFKNNTIKAELIALIKDGREKQAKEAATKAVDAEQAAVTEAEKPAPAATSDVASASPEPAPPVEEQAPAAEQLPPVDPTVDDAPATQVAGAQPPVEPAAYAQEQSSAPVDPTIEGADATSVATIETEVGPVDANGVITEAAVAQQLGGEVLSVDEPVETPPMTEPTTPPPPAPPSPPATTGGTPEPVPWANGVCADCGKPLAGENSDFVKLSMIKYKRYLCNAEFLALKRGG